MLSGRVVSERNKLVFAANKNMFLCHNLLILCLCICRVVHTELMSVDVAGVEFRFTTDLMFNASLV